MTGRSIGTLIVISEGVGEDDREDDGEDNLEVNFRETKLGEDDRGVNLDQPEEDRNSHSR